ncbi:cytochrome c oxidase subunit IV [Syncephalis pseudoplumigaleata]|uniref:Cytochrome c oxidase subunit IV n=1 Tax=Syncephalis pseudoplumigaleata TaxID=1712513 RepID=A0A4P9Z4X6_9FUNG|nr:cytochrome c oxidase subunit IV [Syncephalis pseudoplumigaleata]|eukprot:RKP27654.1 cytochrome c oxidase subunit IV [Syncephalis pseudoplumigaleata]
MANIASTWSNLTAEQRTTLEKQLDERMTADWKTLSAEEKKAAYYIAFGPHGPREPLHKPGFGVKVTGGVVAAIVASAALFSAIRTRAQETPHTMSKEWREQTDEYMRSQKANPITGIASEGYEGKGFSGHAY